MRFLNSLSVMLCPSVVLFVSMINNWHLTKRIATTIFTFHLIILQRIENIGFFSVVINGVTVLGLSILYNIQSIGQYSCRIILLCSRV